jgi:hypothetical protein
MSKWTFARVGALAASVALVALWAAAVTGMANPLGLPDGQSRALRAGTNELGMRVVTPASAEDTQHGVTLKIVEAGFSSSESYLVLEVTGLPSTVPFQDFAHNTTPTVAGFLGGTDLLRSEVPSPSTEGNPRALLFLGPVNDVDKPVTVSLSWTDDSPESPFPLTTWQVSFVPGASARDPIDAFVQLNRAIDYGFLTINVKGAHISSSQVSVYYDMLLDPGVTADPVEGAAKLVYADGQEVFGAATAEFVETLPDGSPNPKAIDPLANATHALTFPLIRNAKEPFQVDFGRFIVTVPEKQEYIVPIDGTAATARLADDTFELSMTGDEDENITIRAQRLPGIDPGGFLVGSAGKTALRDDTGNTYQLLRSETGFRKTEDTEPAADRTILVFAGPLNPKAQRLYLTVPDSAQVVGPADGGHVFLP